MISRTRLLTLGIVLVLIFLSGCQASRLNIKAQTLPKEFYQPTTPAYYFYAAAQLKLKEGDLNEAIWLLEQAVKDDENSDYLKIELANLLLLKKDQAGALEYIEQVLAVNPDHVEALVLSGRVYQEQKQIDKAIQAFEKAIKGNPDEQNLYMLVGRLYWNKSDLENAERIFHQMVVHFPDSYAAHYFYGKVLLSMGKFDDAESALLKSLELEPSLTEPRTELLTIYQNQNKKDKITNIYKSILKNDPDDVGAALELADHYHKINQISASTTILGKLGRQINDNYSIITTLFELYIEPKKYREASWAISGMLKTASENSDLNYLAGIVFDELELTKKALAHLKKVGPESKFHNNAIIHSALLYHDLGKMDQAVDVIRKALANSPDNTDYYLYLGSFYEELERYDDALKILHQGLKRDGQNAKLHFRLGIVYDKKGKKEESISAIKAVLRISPNDAEALNYLGYTYADMGIKLDEAEKLIQKALSIKPEDGFITDSLGWVFYKRGQYAQALKYLLKAAQIVSDDPVILEHLGDVYLKMNNSEKALYYYKRSLKKKDKDTHSLEKKIRELK